MKEGIIKLFMTGRWGLDRMLSEKVYCSKEDRERIVDEWGMIFELSDCYIQITPSFNQEESRKLNGVVPPK